MPLLRSSQNTSSTTNVCCNLGPLIAAKIPCRSCYYCICGSKYNTRSYGNGNCLPMRQKDQDNYKGEWG